MSVCLQPSISLQEWVVFVTYDYDSFKVLHGCLLYEHLSGSLKCTNSTSKQSKEKKPAARGLLDKLDNAYKPSFECFYKNCLVNLELRILRPLCN